MIFTILTTLSILIAAFLVMIAIQLIRIEKAIENCTNTVEVYVKKMYHRS